MPPQRVGSRGTQLLDERLPKVVVGLALQSAIPHGCEVETLLALYSDPNPEKARRLHDKLSASRSHCDREIAIWLRLLLEQGPSKSDPKAMVTTMREMESVLFFLINQVGESQREINDWMNYIANAAESLADGFLIDAKIFLSQASEVSQSPIIERLKSDPSLGRKLDILQRATAQYFEEMRTYPSKLMIPEDRLEIVLRVQEILLDLMQAYYQGKREEDDEVIGGSIRRLNTAVRYLMNKDREVEAAKQELQLASEHLSEKKSRVLGERKRQLVNECSERMKELIETRTI